MVGWIAALHAARDKMMIVACCRPGTLKRKAWVYSILRCPVSWYRFMTRLPVLFNEREEMYQSQINKVTHELVN